MQVRYYLHKVKRVQFGRVFSSIIHPNRAKTSGSATKEDKSTEFDLHERFMKNVSDQGVQTVSLVGGDISTLKQGMLKYGLNLDKLHNLLPHIERSQLEAWINKNMVKSVTTGVHATINGISVGGPLGSRSIGRRIVQRQFRKSFYFPHKSQHNHFDGISELFLALGRASDDPSRQSLPTNVQEALEHLDLFLDFRITKLKEWKDNGKSCDKWWSSLHWCTDENCKEPHLPPQFVGCAKTSSKQESAERHSSTEALEALKVELLKVEKAIKTIKDHQQKMAGARKSTSTVNLEKQLKAKEQRQSQLQSEIETFKIQDSPTDPEMQEFTDIIPFLQHPYLPKFIEACIANLNSLDDKHVQTWLKLLRCFPSREFRSELNAITHYIISANEVSDSLMKLYLMNMELSCRSSMLIHYYPEVISNFASKSSLNSFLQYFDSKFIYTTFTDTESKAVLSKCHEALACMHDLDFSDLVRLAGAIPYVNQGDMFYIVGDFIKDNVSKLKPSEIATFSETLADIHAHKKYSFQKSRWDSGWWEELSERHSIEWWKIHRVCLRDMVRISRALLKRVDNGKTSSVTAVDMASTPTGKLIASFDICFAKQCRPEQAENNFESLDDLENLFDALHYAGVFAKHGLISKQASFIYEKFQENFKKVEDATFPERLAPLTSFLTFYTEVYEHPSVDYSIDFADKICSLMVPHAGVFERHISIQDLRSISDSTTTLPHYTPSVVKLLEALHRSLVDRDHFQFARLSQVAEIIPEMKHLKGPRRPRRNMENPSQSELILADCLQDLGYDFRMAHVLECGLSVDFYLPQQKLAIELDGPQHFLKRSGYVRNSWTRHKQRLLEISKVACIRIEVRKLQQKWHVMRSIVDKSIKSHQP